jgi:putative glutamine amidotransferase
MGGDMKENGPRRSDPIVVVGQWRQGEGRLPLPYVRAITAADGRARIASAFTLQRTDDIPRDVEIVDHIDPDNTDVLDDAAGLVLPGGGDVDPGWYGRPRHPQTHNVNHRRDRFELNLLDAALERDIPVLAICHGMQILNVYLGGTLDQHLADRPGRLDHDRDYPVPAPQHGLHIKDHSLLARVFGGASAGVNSHHHQGVGELGTGLDEVAWAEDGVLEAVVSRNHSWVIGVQWHPEVMAPEDRAQQHLFKAFVAASAQYEVRERAEARESA